MLKNILHYHFHLHLHNLSSALNSYCVAKSVSYVQISLLSSFLVTKYFTSNSLGGSQVPFILEVRFLFRRREPWGGKWVSVGQRAINIWAPSLLESTRILATRHKRFTSHLNSEIPVAQTSQMTSNTFLVLPKYPFHCLLSIRSNILSIVNSFYCEAELRHQIVDTWHLSRHSFPLIGNNWYLISTLNILFFLTDRMQCKNHIKRTFEGRVSWKIKCSVFP